jgi:hypothetical protein
MNSDRWTTTNGKRTPFAVATLSLLLISATAAGQVSYQISSTLIQRAGSLIPGTTQDSVIVL